jgi:hypothetical protein
MVCNGIDICQGSWRVPKRQAVADRCLMAMQIWVEDTNAKGGLLGRPVKLITYDHQSNPALVPGIISKLLDVDHVDILIAGNGTHMVAPALPVAMQRKLTLIGLFGLDVNSEFHYPNYFSIIPAGGAQPKEAFSAGFLPWPHCQPATENHRPGRRRCRVCPQRGGRRPSPGETRRLQDRLRQHLSADHVGARTWRSWGCIRRTPWA